MQAPLLKIKGMFLFLKQRIAMRNKLSEISTNLKFKVMKITFSRIQGFIIPLIRQEKGKIVNLFSFSVISKLKPPDSVWIMSEIN